MATKSTSAQFRVELIVPELIVKNVNGSKHLIAKIAAPLSSQILGCDYHVKITPDIQNVIDTLEGLILSSVLIEHSARDKQLELKGV